MARIGITITDIPYYIWHLREWVILPAGSKFIYSYVREHDGCPNDCQLYFPDNKLRGIFTTFVMHPKAYVDITW